LRRRQRKGAFLQWWARGEFAQNGAAHLWLVGFSSPRSWRSRLLGRQGGPALEMIRARFVPFVDDERPDRDARAPARATPHKPCRRKSTSGERAGACDFRRAWTDSRPPRFARRLFSLSSAARCRGTGAAGGRGCPLNPIAGNRRAERAPGLARSIASRPNRAARDSRAVCS
jgi:hypothetical protein